MTATASIPTPLWESHRCARCVFLGGLNSIDVYECFKLELPSPGERTFVVRAGPLPNGGFVLRHADSTFAMNPPEGVTADQVRTAIEAVLEARA